jgi:rubrerythrin
VNGIPIFKATTRMTERELADMREVLADWWRAPETQPLVLNKGMEVQWLPLPDAGYWRCAYCGNVWALGTGNCRTCGAQQEELGL